MKTSTCSRKAFLLLLFFMVNLAAFAQKTVKGQVKDDKGEPMIGVNVLVSGTTNGTITDVDGNYHLTNVSDRDKLIFSYIGYISQTLPVAGKSQIDVVLKEDTETLEEVVVVGYGVMKKSDLTGAVASVKSQDLQKVASSNAMQAMQAKIPGLDIQQNDGQAGSSISINLRGNRSLAAGNSPLILVDGVEYGSTLDINPSDIESMEVLKDASSTAIYGSKGANGVIIITTKRGKAGKTQVDFNTYVSLNSPTHIPRVMIGQREVQRLIDKANYAADYKSGNWGQSALTAEQVLGNSALDDGTLMTDIIKDGSYTDWADLILRNSVSTNYEVSASGGSEKTHFNLSLGHMKDNGLMQFDNLARYNGKINIDHTISDLFKVGSSLLYTYKSKNQRNAGVFSQSLKMTSITHPYLKDGSLNATPNPLYAAHCSPLLDDVEGNYQRNIESSRFFGNTYLQITPMKGMFFKTLFNLDRNDSRDGLYQDYESQARYQSPKTSYMSNSRSTHTDYTWQNTLNYTTRYKQHDFTFLLGHEMSQSVTETASMGGDMGQEHYYKSSFYDISKVSNPVTSTGYVKQSILSYFGRLNYKFANRYLLTVSYRADGSSVLAPGRKWASFPSVAAGWTLKEESFLSHVNWLDNLKLRASWGISGNAAISPYQTMGALVAAVEGSADRIPASLANKDLTWEKTTATNIGLDFGFFNNRITGNIDYYNSRTTDLLYYSNQAGSSVFTSVIGNVGSTKGSGIEVGLNTVLIDSKNFNWTANWSYSHSKDEVTKLSQGLTRNIDGNTGFIVGQPVSIFYDYLTDGCWNIGEYEQYVADFKAAHNGTAPVQPVKGYGDPGTVKIVDRNGDGQINDDDRTVFERSPKHIFGMNNSFTYKDFTLIVQVFARLGGYISYGMNEQLNYESANWGDIDYWTPANTGAKFPSPGLTQAAAYNTFKTALMYEKADYIKVKDITLTYNFSKKLLHPLKVINNLRLYGSLKNFFTFSGIDNYDPERGGSISFPLQKQVVFGLNVQF